MLALHSLSLNIVAAPPPFLTDRDLRRDLQAIRRDPRDLSAYHEHPQAGAEAGWASEGGAQASSGTTSTGGSGEGRKGPWGARDGKLDKCDTWYQFVGWLWGIGNTEFFGWHLESTEFVGWHLGEKSILVNIRQCVG